MTRNYGVAATESSGVAPVIPNLIRSPPVLDERGTIAAIPSCLYGAPTMQRLSLDQPLPDALRGAILALDVLAQPPTVHSAPLVWVR